MAAPQLNSYHIIAGISPSDGGPSYSVPTLVDGLCNLGVESTALTVRSSEHVQEFSNNVKYFAHDLKAFPLLNSLRFSSQMKRYGVSVIQKTDIIHNHGLWLAPNTYAGLISKTTNAPLFISPRGMLSKVSLNFSKFKKELAWRYWQKRALSSIACVHATSEMEADEVRDFGITAPVVVIPNGVDLIDLRVFPRNEYSNSRKRRFTYLGRIHPKKGLVRLLRAWALIQDAGLPDIELQICGPDENNHVSELRAFVRSNRLQNVVFLDAKYGDAKWRLLRDSDVFVLPTKNENFGIVVAEAMSAGIPSIVTKGAPWQELNSLNLGWWVDQTDQAISEAILAASRTPIAELESMGKKCRVHAAKNYSWHSVCEKMRDAYNEFGNT
ncbi:MAG: glycosyltransferase [Henriciella sp.]